MLKSLCRSALAVGLMAFFSAGAASATTITTCNTGPLQGCFVSVEGLDRTEAIAKINFGTSDVLEVNTSFGDGNVDLTGIVDLGNFDLTGLTRQGDGTVTGGTMTYSTSAVDEPGMTAFSLKTGTTEELFFALPDLSLPVGTAPNLTWTLDFSNKDPQNAVSNVVIYDNYDFGVVPLPAGMPLLLAGLGGLFVLKRRKRAS